MTMLNQINLTDNTKNISVNFDITNRLNCIANKSVNQLLEDNPNLLLYPNYILNSEDGIGKSSVFDINSKNQISTGNMMGFISIGETKGIQVNIHSRFDKSEEDHKDYFLQYMIQKVFCPNIFNLDIKNSDENIWDILPILMLPYYLKKAFNQGLYKCYTHKNYNDSNVKGRIDINRHIKKNMPFQGKVAYSVRELTYDNKVTQLIRHTIHYVLSKYDFVLRQDRESLNISHIITEATPSWNNFSLKEVIKLNIDPIIHPLYTEYEPLRKLCLKILNTQGASLLDSSDQCIHGILFDGAWLWEEYLNTLLNPKGFRHPENQKKKGALYLFKGDKYSRYPDFYHAENKFILDAKYKRNWDGGYDRDDIHQLISYMYIGMFKTGCLVYPNEKGRNGKTDKKFLNGYGDISEEKSSVYSIGLGIPQSDSIKNYNQFVEEIIENENVFLDWL